MNPMQAMKDPASGVPRELLPHLHLISKHRYPVNNNPSLETIIAYLLEAPKVTREAQPVQWQYLDCPQDGSIFLTYQPPDLGINFASDGYIWADSESPFNSEVRGYTLQMFMHKSGFRPQGEQMATHCRRRYRLIQPQHMAGPGPDPSLWLIHYSKAAPRDHVATSTIPIPGPVHAQLQQRRMIMSAGALPRKEFMLHDRPNWPTINLPGTIGRHAAAGQAAANAHRRGQSLAGHEPTIEEEEDVSRGDALDFMTPREMSRMRYEQHHEWMEEIMESPYRTMQIVPPSLGLGRKGELEAFTKDFFDAPVGTSQESTTDTKVASVGRLDPGKAEEFTRLANQKLANMQLELQKMKQAHQKRMEKLRKVTTLSAAEKKLRSASAELSQRKSMADGKTSSGMSELDPMDNIVKEVEHAAGRKIDRVKNVTRVAQGGYQEQRSSTAQTSEPGQTLNNSVKANPETHAPTNEQKPNPQPPQPQPQPEPQLQVQTLSETPNQSTMPAQTSPTTLTKQSTEESDQQQGISNDGNFLPDDDVGDIEMGDGDDEPQDDDGGLGEANDWVMVGDTTMGDDIDTPSLDNLAKSIGDDDDADDQTPINTGFTPGGSATQTPQPLQQLSGQHGEHLPTGQTPLDTGDYDFDDVNTAGDALADYGADDVLNLDNMDDSAFGDAFHASDDHDLA